MARGRRKTVREYGAPELVPHFVQLNPGAHSIKGRDNKLVSEWMMRTGLDPVDVLYLMNEYRGNRPIDIRGLIRWEARHDPLEDTTYAYRELIVAEILSGKRAPREALSYFDLEGIASTAAQVKHLARAEAALRAFVDPILGERLS